MNSISFHVLSEMHVGSILFVSNENESLSDAYFGSIQYQSDMLKKSLKFVKNINSVNSHIW